MLTVDYWIYRRIKITLTAQVHIAEMIDHFYDDTVQLYAGLLFCH